MSTWTGITERCARARNAGPRPPRDRIAGWIPREISCRSRSAATNPVATPDSRAHREAERDQLLLHTVMEVALDLPAGLVRRRDDAATRLREFGTGFRVGDRGGDQIGELSEPLLVARGERLRAVCRDKHDAPHPAVDGDRRGDRGAPAVAACDVISLAGCLVVAVETRRLARLGDDAEHVAATDRGSRSNRNRLG